MKKRDKRVQVSSIWVSGLPRSTTTPIHHFVQYAKVTLLEISPCQCFIVKRSGARRCILLFLCTLGPECLVQRTKPKKDGSSSVYRIEKLTATSVKSSGWNLYRKTRHIFHLSPWFEEVGQLTLPNINLNVDAPSRDSWQKYFDIHKTTRQLQFCHYFPRFLYCASVTFVSSRELILAIKLAVLKARKCQRRPKPVLPCADADMRGLRRATIACSKSPEEKICTRVVEIGIPICPPALRDKCFTDKSPKSGTVYYHLSPLIMTPTLTLKYPYPNPNPKMKTFLESYSEYSDFLWSVVFFDHAWGSIWVSKVRSKKKRKDE